MKREREEYKESIFNTEKTNHIKKGQGVTGTFIDSYPTSDEINKHLSAKTTHWNTHRIDFYNLIHTALHAAMRYRKTVDIDWDIQINQPSVFFSDRFRLLILLNFILKNVINTLNSDKEEQLVSIEVTATSKEVGIQITDNGEGASKAVKNCIYALFERVVKSSQGFDMGYHLFNDGIEYIQGSINIYSSPGIGTQYNIKLPNKLPQEGNLTI
ncbi:ATP-binding protein [Fulvivirga sp. M361]|uniref:ATP-binding protein n=1 Tax=Fulvivirga sp. M361 TaxID=2594266 RepID=UPI0016270307|nr:ATP-binding protein [Fulvivirga sp. M361]